MGLISVCQTESVTKLFDSLLMFYYINGRLPNTDGHLFVPGGETPPGIIEEKLSLKELFAKFFRTGSNGLVSLSPFLVVLLLFFVGKETLAKNFLTELYKNLTAEVLSSGNSENPQFDALTDLYVQIGAKLENSTFAKHERAWLHEKAGRGNKQKI